MGKAPVRHTPTMAEAAIEAASTGELTEWGALNHVLRMVPAAQSVVVYRFLDGSVMWRYADESALHIGTENPEQPSELPRAITHNEDRE